ncbi:MAG: acyltransferase 3 [Ramlibacter sp.]|nr:acyltransferase 3 [Ramlibacter sp.]
MTTSPRDIPTLDGWRAVAVLFVIFSHGYPSLESVGFPSFASHGRLGLLGVEIFFALSGYLITTRLLRGEQVGETSGPRIFYVRRAFRILPAALCYVAAVAMLSEAGFIRVAWDRIAHTVLFAANYSPAEPSYYLGHFWSLAVEEHFYLAWPLAFFLLPRQRLRIAIAVAFATVVWRMVAWKFHLTTEDTARFFGRTDIQLDAIAFGVVLALLLAKERWRARIDAFVTAPRAWVIVLLACAACVTVRAGWKTDFSLSATNRLLLPLLIYGTVRSPNWALSRLLELAPLRFVGRISFSLYLWQQLFLVAARSETGAGALSHLQTFPFNIAAAFGCAVVSYYLVERPCIRWGHHLARPRRKDVLTAPMHVPT